MKTSRNLTKISFTIFAFFISFLTTAQLTYTAPNVSPVSCHGGTTTISLTLQNGTAPYSVTYHDGLTTNTVTSPNPSIYMQIPASTVGTFIYTLVSASDANAQTVAINQEFTVQVVPLPNVQAVVTQTPCSFTICGSGAITYTISNGFTTCQPFTPSTLGTTTFTITGTDMNGCSNNAQSSFTVMSLPPSASNTPVAVIDSAYCSDGSIQLSLTTPAPFSVSWDNINSTSPFVAGLSAGIYTATVADTAGCVFDVSYTVPLSLIPTTCGIIKGSVHYDLDENCSLTPGDQVSSYKLIRANPGNHITFTDNDGKYELRLDPGTYTIEEIINYPNVAPVCNSIQTVTLSEGQIVENIDFMDTLSGEIDLGASGYISQIRPDFNFTFSPLVGNILPLFSMPSTEAWFLIPQDVTFLGWNHPHTISNDTVYYNAASANLGHAHFHAGNVELEDTVTFCTGVEVSPLENNILNNQHCLSTIAVGSYDPNDKTTFVNGNPTNGTIYPEDQVLDYRIRFQNTGTADAINVSVIDTIQGTLDLSSFQLLETSHACNLVLLEGNVLKFDFPNIHLPDSTTDEAGSHGYIYYRIRQNPSNMLGTTIKNTAYIYFDFNEPVITNTTQDLIAEPLRTNKLTSSENVEVFPNPTQTQLQVSAHSSVQSVKILGLNGQILAEEKPQKKQFSIDFSTQGQGIYLLLIETETGVTVKKIQKI